MEDARWLFFDLGNTLMAAKLLGAPPMMLDSRTKADSSKERCVI
jgi:hypothetical protein